MSQQPRKGYHSLETMQRLQRSALPTRDENPSAPDAVTRRDVLKLMMGASTALAFGTTGCARKPEREIISRATGPEYQKPGKALYYSSTYTDGPVPYGVMIKTVDGRPVKIEGNPDHPVNRGASDAAMQAWVLSLYDPDRLREPTEGIAPTTWAAADDRIVAALRQASSVVLMTRANLGPSERALVKRFTEVCPGARHFVHEAVHDSPRRSAWNRLYGADGEWLPRFDLARVIVSLDSDFLATDGAALENIRLFTRGRKLDDAHHGQADISRLYVAESAMSLTGSNADERIRLKPSAMGAFARALLDAVRGRSEAIAEFARARHVDEKTLTALTKDLRENSQRSVVVAGPHLHQHVHAAVALLNDELQAPGHTLVWNPVRAALPVSDPAEVESVFERGVDVAIFLGVNPVYDWPGGGFAAPLQKAALSVGHGLYRDETLAACTLALPSHHGLESWNDAVARAGVESICQPVIAPLFNSRQEAASLLAWTRALAPDSDPIRTCSDWHDYVRARWQGESTSEGEAGDRLTRGRRWQDCLRRGGRFEELTAASPPRLNRDAAQALTLSPMEAGVYELVIQPDPALWDGRFAGNGWLQELPDPVSKVVWDSGAIVSPHTAKGLGLAEGDMVVVEAGGRSVELPLLVQPGAVDGVVSAYLGYGRTEGGVIIEQAQGANLAPLLGRESPSHPRLALKAALRPGSGHRKLVRTQKQFSMHDRPIVLDGTLQEYRHDAGFVEHKRHLPELVQMYDPWDYSKGYRWAMAVDLGACVGCNACVAACQAENNIPIVGRDQVDRGREMQWIRIDRYHAGDADNPTVHHQPMLCQHCDNAPCESVCPVNATSHSPEGLNEMTYNRCVGTRYCSNNCPYKVRRFNFLRYHDAQLRDPVQELVFNPQVTVRGVGVMEKCTFCVQRINEGKFKARNSDQQLADGTIQTACQQACPAQAITFGNVNDPNSAVAKMNASTRTFFVLEELNVKPNVAYLARVRNPVSQRPGHDPSDGSRHG
jgi:molybdopterin-containing oxidoreductase family iron-sulfur binding subunit